MKKAKKITFVLILVALALCVVGTTLAWLQDSTEEVTNTFTPSKVKVYLEETQEDRNFEMIPGWTIDKEAKAWVDADSEDCYLFVEVTESDNLGQYIAYAIDEQWTLVPGTTNVYYMELIGADEKGEAHKYDILGGVDKASDKAETIIVNGTTLSFGWGDNEVLVKPSVTEEDMDALKAEADYPTLKFKAYATQLYKNNTDKFEPADAWAIAKPVVTP